MSDGISPGGTPLSPNPIPEPSETSLEVSERHAAVSDVQEPPSPEDRLLEADLDEWLAGDTTTPATDDIPDYERSQFLSEDQADRELWKWRRAARELARIDRLVDAQRERLDRWRQDRSAGPRRMIERCEANLETIARALNEQNPRRKTITLPNGTLKLSGPGQSSLKVDDQDAAVAWLKDNGLSDRIRVTSEVAVSELKKVAVPAAMSAEASEGTASEVVTEWVTVGGEIVPGCHFERPVRSKFKAYPS